MQYQRISTVRNAPVLQQPLPLDFSSLSFEFVFLLCEQWALWCLLLPCCLSIRRLTERWAAAALSLNASISLSPFRSHRPRNGGSIRLDPRTHTVLHYPSSQPTAFRSHFQDPYSTCAWAHVCMCVKCVYMCVCACMSESHC